MTKFNSLQQQAYDRAAFLCSRSEKSSGSIRKKLAGWGLEQEDAQAVLKKLTDEHFIDDERFDCSYVKDKFRFNKWGKIRIAWQLKLEQIPAVVISRALEEISDEAYEDLLLKLLAAKNKTIGKVSPPERRVRLMRFAQSRGFENGLIHSVIDRIGLKDDD